MACEYSGRVELSGYLDGELALDRVRWWDQHLTGCPACSEALTRLKELRASLRSHLPPREPSSSLHDAIRQLIRAERRDDSAAPGLRSWQLGLAAAALFAVGLGVGHVARDGASDPVVDQVVAGHVRSLAVDHLVDVASSEHHVVKPWFAGKLDFSPPVPDLEAAGYPLVGARIEYLGGREVAALVYTRGPHRINLLLWPKGKSAACGREPVIVRQGFNLAHGWAAGMELWAVSDLNGQELEAFVARWQRDASPADRRCG